MSFKRKVFYLSGFDPRGARHYHALYAEQAARYAALAGEDVAVSARRRGSGATTIDWTVANATADVRTDYAFLPWDDLIRGEWIADPGRLLAGALRTYRRYLARIDWKTARSYQRGPLVTLFYPLATIVVLPLVAFLVLFAIGAALIDWRIALGLAILAAVLAAIPLVKRLRSFWLLRFFIFNDAMAGDGMAPALAARLDAFAAAIDAALDGDHDEILLVTHSNGSILAVPLMDRLLARRGGAMPDRFALVTLGHCIPLLSLRADAGFYRASLETVNRGDFRWIDIGSPPDGAAYTQTDPFGPVGGVARPRLDMVSARIFKFHDRAAYEARRRNKYEFHFEYLRVGDRLSPIDHPSMTAGARPIAAAVAAFRAIR